MITIDVQLNPKLGNAFNDSQNDMQLKMKAGVEDTICTSSQSGMFRLKADRNYDRS